MGSSPSREMPQENGEERKPQKVKALEESTRMSRQSESPSRGVKRKRKRSSQGEPQLKKQKSSPLPTLELPNNTRVSSLQGGDGDDNGTSRSTTGAPSRTSNGMLTSISKKNRKIKRRRVVRPQANKDQDEDSNHCEPEYSEASEADETRSHAGTESDLTCIICGRQFLNQRHLKRHMRNLSVHKKRHTCAECNEGFFRQDDLKRHQRDSGHKSRVSHATGPFTEKEKAKLARFKRRICNDYSVSEFDFNTLMTLLGRRDGSEWPNPDVTRAELRGMFYDVLPDRTRKSLNRYRERYFQNVEQDTEWTEEQINDLKNLVQEKGRKWVEIAEKLGRTQDSVYQKWKNRIRQGDAQRFERWEEKEKEALILAVRECKIAAKVPLDFSSDDKVNWTAVSDRLGKTRNAQQCSTFWKRVYRPREEAKACGQHFRLLPLGRSKSEPTKGRHQTRRRVTRGGESVEVITPRREIKSAMYVTESDEENNTSVSNTQSKKGNQRSNSEAHSMISYQSTESEQDENGVEEADMGEQERSHKDEDEDRGDNNGEIDSSSKKSQRKILIEVLIPPPASSEHFREQQTTLNGSFQVVDRRHHESDQPSSHNRTNPPIDNEAVPLRSSQTQKAIRPPSISKRTPRQVITLSQAFNNTQAPTSARTAGRITPSMRSREDRPSPEIQIQPRPLLEEELSVLEPKEEDNGQTQQQEPRAHRGAEFAIYDSEAEDSNEEQPPEIFSSAAPSGDGVESETASDSESQLSDDEQSSQMFSSVAPGVQNDAEAVKSGSEESEEEEEPPPMFSSAALPLPLPKTARQAHNANGLDTEEAEEAEEDDESPLKVFTSALPDHDPAARSEASSSSGDAPTIFPDESDSDDGRADDDSTGTGPGTDSGGDSGQSMVDAAQGDFFANLEASARKAKSFRQGREREMAMKLQLRNANVGRKSGGNGGYGSGDGTAEGRRSNRRRKKKADVFDVSSSGEEEW